MSLIALVAASLTAFVGCESFKPLAEELGKVAIEVTQITLVEALNSLAEKNPEYSNAINKVKYSISIPFAEQSTNPDDYVKAIQVGFESALQDEQLIAELSGKLKEELQGILDVPATGQDRTLLVGITGAL